MAATLLPTPSVGAANWNNWITLVDASRRGYMAVSYTNYAASAESAIAAGSLVEVAGAMYSFTETAITYTGGGSTNSDLYIYVMPDAVLSTASVVAWGSAPVWVSGKQGFYASAASLARCIGGMYVENAGSYNNKYLYIGENIDYCLQSGNTRPLLHKTLSMGEWNMQASVSLFIPHNLKVSKFRNVQVIVYIDTLAWLYPLDYGASTAEPAGYWVVGTTEVQCGRIGTGGTFYSVLFDGTASTVPNRGYVYIEYEA